MNRYSQRYQPQVVDRLTGEIIEFDLNIRHARGGKFMKVWQGTGWESRIGELQGTSMKILWHLVTVAKWGNVIPGPSDTAASMELRQSNVSRAYKELVQAEFVYKIGTVYYLSPYFCWKGNDQQYEMACRELSARQITMIGAPS